MSRSSSREYDKEDVEEIYDYISENEPLDLDDVLRDFGPNIDEEVLESIETLVRKGIIGSKSSFIRARLDFSPWDTIIYDSINDGMVRVNENDEIYMTDNPAAAKLFKDINNSVDK